ncbi:autoinducer binding domain-containing protein [Psychromarinibacter sp. C21-152]|uniref:Autoinducer binding domain-containing protein n=1 Tax=Psychromarinibacter sediminicola TaxID=3033385 RepID=A0AAE3NPY4_9RHOB|nr:autoinducer binding domain-containing protein [Psychromarinibacter sediminicola]MDF0599951.1 autoinducer binding domain-containing protein [Psychromarinibacter sediminicola]
MAGILSDLDDRCPLGFAIALHIRYNAPTFLFQTFPENWMEAYSRNGFVIRDPAVHWAFENTGFIRWRDLAVGDRSGVMEQARLYGLNYGFTVSIHNDRARSIAGFARSDRDFLDVEIDEIAQLFEELDVMTAGIEILSKKDTDALQKMSIRMTHR